MISVYTYGMDGQVTGFQTQYFLQNENPLKISWSGDAQNYKKPKKRDVLNEKIWPSCNFDDALIS